MKKFNYISFYDWYVNKTSVAYYTSLINMPFEFRLGTYLNYFESQGIIIASFTTGYILHDIKTTPITWIKSEDNLKAKRIIEQYEVAMLFATEFINTKIKEQNEPF